MSAEDSGRSCAYRVRHALLLVQEHCSFIDRSHHLRSVGPSKDMAEAPVFDLCLVLLSRVSHFRGMHPSRECGKVANTLNCAYTAYAIYVIWGSPIMLNRGRLGRHRFLPRDISQNLEARQLDAVHSWQEVSNLPCQIEFHFTHTQQSLCCCYASHVPPTCSIPLLDNDLTSTCSDLRSLSSLKEPPFDISSARTSVDLT